jgi:hypothetical protein
MTATTPLADVAPAFVEMAHRIVWCVAATVTRRGAPRTRVLHPIWEWDGTTLTGWIATSPRSPKARDLARMPELSLTYWSRNHDTCTADCATQWDDSPEGREAGWRRFAEGPAPVGYDPSLIPGWTSPHAPDFGILRVTPYRLSLMPGTVMMQGIGERLMWRDHR